MNEIIIKHIVEAIAVALVIIFCMFFITQCQIKESQNEADKSPLERCFNRCSQDVVYADSCKEKCLIAFGGDNANQ